MICSRLRAAMKYWISNFIRMHTLCVLAYQYNAVPRDRRCSLYTAHALNR